MRMRIEEKKCQSDREIDLQEKVVLDFFKKTNQWLKSRDIMHNQKLER